MNNIQISQLKQNQVEDFFELFKKIANTNFDKWTHQSKQKWFLDYSVDFWKANLKKGCPVLVAILDSNMVGYIAIEAINFGVAYVGWIGILKEFQKIKIGTLLIEQVELWCKQNNIHKIELETQEPGLECFYKKHGFTLEGIRKNSWQHLDNFMFGKNLEN